MPQETRWRELLAGIEAFLAAGRQANPLPLLQDLASDWLRAEHVKILIPAGSGPIEPPDPCVLHGSVMIGRRVIGRIEAQRGWPFGAEERALLVPLGRLIGAALERNMLQNQVDQYEHTVSTYAEMLEHLLNFDRREDHVSDPQAIAIRVATQLPAMIGSDRASVLLIGPECPSQPLLALSNGTLASPERACEVAQHGLAGVVLRERIPLIIDETDTDRRWLSLKLDTSDTRTRCAMAAPLLYRGQVLGVLTATTTRSRAFHTTHLSLMELLAHHVAMDLQVAYLQRRLATVTAHLDTLARELEIALALNGSGNGTDRTRLEAVAAQLRAEQASLRAGLTG